MGERGASQGVGWASLPWSRFAISWLRFVQSVDASRVSRFFLICRFIYIFYSLWQRVLYIFKSIEGNWMCFGSLFGLTCVLYRWKVVFRSDTASTVKPVMQVAGLTLYSRKFNQCIKKKELCASWTPWHPHRYECDVLHGAGETTLKMEIIDRVVFYRWDSSLKV